MGGGGGEAGQERRVGGVAKAGVRLPSHSMYQIVQCYGNIGCRLETTFKGPICKIQSPLMAGECTASCSLRNIDRIIISKLNPNCSLILPATFSKRKKQNGRNFSFFFFNSFKLYYC